MPGRMYSTNTNELVCLKSSKDQEVSRNQAPLQTTNICFEDLHLWTDSDRADWPIKLRSKNLDNKVNPWPGAPSSCAASLDEAALQTQNKRVEKRLQDFELGFMKAKPERECDFLHDLSARLPNFCGAICPAAESPHRNC